MAKRKRARKRGKCHRVKGFTRKGKGGRRIRVKAHTRCG